MFILFSGRPALRDNRIRPSPLPHSNFLHRIFLYSWIDTAGQLNGCDPSNLFVKAMNHVRVGGLSIRKLAKKSGELKDHSSRSLKWSGWDQQTQRPTSNSNKAQRKPVSRLADCNGKPEFRCVSIVFTLHGQNILWQRWKKKPFSRLQTWGQMVSLFCLAKPSGKITKVTTSWKETGKDLEIETPGLIFLVEKNLADKPSQIWNGDETGFDMQGRAGNVIGQSDRKEAQFYVFPGSREHVTALLCFNACGQRMPHISFFEESAFPLLTIR